MYYRYTLIIWLPLVGIKRSAKASLICITQPVHDWITIFICIFFDFQQNEEQIKAFFMKIDYNSDGLIDWVHLYYARTHAPPHTHTHTHTHTTHTHDSTTMHMPHYYT